MSISLKSRTPYVNVMNKKGPEFEYWLKSNISDLHHRDWYREDTVSRTTWLERLESAIHDRSDFKH